MKDPKKWEKSKEFRQSMPEIVPEIIRDLQEENKEGDSYIDKINKYFLNINEVKYVYKKTRIKPFFYLIFFIFALSFILVGYFDKQLTLIIATTYPLFMTFKALQNFEDEDINQNKMEVIHWLKYWIFFCVFLNFESLFGYFFRRVYFVFKIIFLINCFFINSKLTKWIYNSCKQIVINNEKKIVENFKNIYDHITQTKKEFDKKREAKKKEENNKEIDVNEKLNNLINGGKSGLAFINNLYNK